MTSLPLLVLHDVINGRPLGLPVVSRKIVLTWNFLWSWFIIQLRIVHESKRNNHLINRDLNLIAKISKMKKTIITISTLLAMSLANPIDIHNNHESGRQFSSSNLGGYASSFYHSVLGKFLTASIGLNPNRHGGWYFYLLVIWDQILSADFLSKLFKLFEGEYWHQSAYWAF